VKTMQGGHYLDGPVRAYWGGVEIPELDYVEVGELLATDLCRDYTFLHPKALNEKCAVEGDMLKLSNPVNYEHYKVMIIPGHTTIEWANLKKIKAFYDQGGKVIATGTLPYKSAEFGHDADVVAAIRSMFPGAPLGKVESSFSASTSWSGYGPELAFDGSEQTRWNAKDGTRGNQWLEVSFEKELPVNQVEILEMFGRTSSYRIQYMKDGQWVDWVSGQALGKKTHKLEEVVTSKARLCMDTVKGRDSVSIAEFSVTLDGKVPVDAVAVPAVTSTNSKGGMAVFLKTPTAQNLRETLDAMVDTYDVEFEPDKELRYIHKVKDGKEIFFFANLNNRAINSWVELRGTLAPELWNPHTGAIQPAEFSHAKRGAVNITRVKLELDRVQSVFLVADAKSDDL